MARFEEGQEVDGRYRLIRKIGAGGMADVWVATDQMLDRRVALKFLHERFAQDQQFVERFRREATAAAGLQHPNVVGVYDRGEWDETHYIAMEYVEGASLKDLIERGLSVGEAVEITRQILAGARFAHERGIVHRDLKPGNVMVDADGRARVTDFGIARAGASEITQTGSVLGTAHYLSPEQAQGLDVTASSDLYSIGVILYEALTGRVPFEGDTAVSIALQQVSERPNAPSQVNPSVTRALDAVVLRALAKEPANRFGSADEFSRALDAAEADPTGGALGDTASYAAVAAAAGAAAANPEEAMAHERQAAHQEEQERWMTRKRALIIAAIALLLAAVAVFALTRPASVSIPNVTGKDRAEAERILEAKGFEVSAESRPFCTDAGTVVEQDPADGDKADEGSTVTITVSQGQQVAVPKVAGLPLEKARGKIKDAQLLMGPEREKFSSRAKPGVAVGSQPSQGTSVACGSAVTLLVSKGTNTVALPDVVGQQEVDAKAELERLGFIVDVDERDADEPEGQVISQSPGGGSTLSKGATVSLIVSTGAGTVVVPDVEGQTQSAAESNLTGLGLNVSVDEDVTTDPSEDGRVIDQAPSQGTRVRSGDTVTIVVGVFEEPPEEEEPPPDDEAPRAAQPGARP